MKKITVLILALFLFSVISVAALTSEEAKQNWLDAKQKTTQANADYKQAQLDYAKDPSEANNKKVIDSAKTVMNDALDEAEAWLNWKNIEAKENSDVPKDIKEKIENDVNANLGKIADLRKDVDGVSTRAQAGGVFLKMVGKYVELLTDVARDTGYMWVHIANTNADKIDDYEAKLRDSASGNADLIAKLDIAKAELETARSKINMAEKAYDNVKLPGTPFIKFAEGNGYLNQARANMINSYLQLEFVYNSIVRGT
jgi:hypothetical protein